VAVDPSDDVPDLDAGGGGGAVGSDRRDDDAFFPGRAVERPQLGGDVERRDAEKRPRTADLIK